MSISPPDGGRSKFTREGVRDYERRRYRGLDQRIVHAREISLVRKLLAIVASSPAPAGPGMILDLPCGYGRFTSLLRARAAAVVNADLSYEMVKRAVEASGEPGAAADATKGLPFKPGAFSAVVSIRFFHHLHDPGARAAVLGEFARVSAGWAVVTFYRMSPLHLAQRKIRKIFGKSRTRIKMTEPGLFEREAASAGFDVIRVLPLVRGLHAYHAALLRKSERPPL